MFLADGEMVGKEDKRSESDGIKAISFTIVSIAQEFCFLECVQVKIPTQIILQRCNLDQLVFPGSQSSVQTMWLLY